MPELSGFASGPRRSDPTVRIAELAERQWGVVSRTQLRGIGATEGTLARAVGSARLHRVHPSVYAVGHRALAVEGRLAAALLYAGPGAALSHTTAAAWWQLIDAEPRRVHVSAPGYRRSLPAVRVHHPRALTRVRHRRLPVTPVARTLLDLASVVSFDRLRRALSEADYRGLLDEEDVIAVLRRGHRGSARLRAALDRHLPELAQTRSALERGFVALCEHASIPMPEINAIRCGLTVDALWPRHRVVVELDGQRAHGGRASVAVDRDRELRLRQAGYRVLRYSWRQVKREPEAIARDLMRALEASVPAPDASVPAPDASVPVRDASVPAPDASVPVRDASLPARAPATPQSAASVARAPTSPARPLTPPAPSAGSGSR